MIIMSIVFIWCLIGLISSVSLIRVINNGVYKFNAKLTFKCMICGIFLFVAIPYLKEMKKESNNG